MADIEKQPLSVVQQQYQPVPIYDGPPRAAKCCGCCCDMRRATLILSILFLGLSFINFVIYLGAASFVTAESDNIDDDYFLDTVERSYTAESITSGIGIITNACSLVGALNYNTKLVMINIGWMAIEYIVMISISVATVKDLSEILDQDLPLPIGTYILSAAFVLLYIYPMASFVREVNLGILTRETYPREEYSCCCTNNRRY